MKKIKTFYSRALVIHLVATLLVFPTLTQAAPNKAQKEFASSYAGRIIKEAGADNKAWYVDPDSLGRIFLGSPEQALNVLLSLGLGISNRVFDNVPLENESRTGPRALMRHLTGRVIIKVEDKGRAYFVNPLTLKASPLASVADAAQLINERSIDLAPTKLEMIGLNDYNPLLQDNKYTDTAGKAEVKFVPGEVVIKFKSKSTADLIARALAKPNAEVFLSKFLSRLGRVDTSLAIKAKKIESGRTGLRKMTFDKSIKVEDIISQLNKSPEVEYAEPNFVYKVFNLPNDPYYSSQGSWGQSYQDLWGIKKIQSEKAWDTAEGAGQIVAVIDTGLDSNHPDIKDNVWINSKEIPNNGIDDDNNGFIDDVNGWDFTTCEIFYADCVKPKIEDNNPFDGDGHGTHVAGTIAASGNNDLGVIGVAPKAKIMALKGLNDQGAGYSADLAKAIRYAASNGAKVINMSWGGSGSSKVIEEAINYAASLGVVLVAAAGNSDEDVSPGFYPANYSQVIAVAATDENDKRSTFSNYGAKILVAAPGGGSTDASPNKLYRNILSLRSGITDMYGDGLNVVGTNYYRSRGTSMASPHVAGLAALILSANPSLTSEQVAQIIQASADDVESPGPDLLTGSGRVNATAALNIQTTPTISLTSPADGSVLVHSDGSINIIGSAAGNGFASYQLSYWSENLLYWIPIGAKVETPITNSILGSWNIKDLTTGPYLLRLAVGNTQGQVFSKIIKVEIENYFPQAISITPGFQIRPKISGDLIVWSDMPNLATPEALFIYDLASKTETQLTDRTFAAQGPDISGNRIVWRSYGSSNDIYLCNYNRATKQCAIQPITSDGFNQSEPAIDASRIVWQDQRDGNWDIFVRDLNKGTNERLTSNSDNQSNPDISGNLVVWEDWGSSHPTSDVFLYDLSKKTLVQLTSDPSWQGNAAVSANRVVWEDKRNGNPDIYTCVYDAATGQCPEEKLAPGGAARTMPDISGNRVVWRETNNYNEDIYLYDLAKPNSAPEAVTSTKSYQELPAIDKNRVVWEDSRNSPSPWTFWDIYMADLGESGTATTTPPVIPEPAPKPVPVPDKIFSFTSPSGGESFEIGKSYNITWQTASTTANLLTARLSLYKDEAYKDFVALDIPNTGSFAWTIPELTVGSGYKLRLFNSAYSNNYTDSGIFSVITTTATTTPTTPSPTPTPAPVPDKIFSFTSPVGGESFEIGKSYNIAWQTASTTANLLTARLSLYKDEAYKDFVAIDIPNSGAYSWTVPNLVTGSGYKLRLFNSAYPNNYTDSNIFSVAAGTATTPTPTPAPPSTATSTPPTLPSGSFTASLPSTVNGTTGRVVTLSGSVSNLGTGNYITKYEWDYTNDGIFDYVSAGAIPQSSVDHLYTVAGTYAATFRATDNLGRQATASTLVNISP